MPPASAKMYGKFVGQLAARYGPKGTFWAANPKTSHARRSDPGRSGTSRRASRASQDRTSFWEAPRDQALPTYVAMLKASRARVRKVDRNAKIVCAGFFGQSWKTLSQLYAAGGGKYFDTAAIHPYARTVGAVVSLLRMVRQTMATNGDAAKPLTITEFGWTSSRGKVTTDAGYVETDLSGQAVKLRQAYRAFWKDRKELRLTGAYWHTWATKEQATNNTFDYAGLNRLMDDGRIIAKPAAKAYRKVAAQLRQG